MKNVVVKNVDIQAKKGMTIAYAMVDATSMKITASEGESVTVAPNAKVTMK